MVTGAVAQGIAIVGVGLGVLAPLFFLLMALAVIPFGSTYAFPIGTLSFVLAPVESAVLFVVALFFLATLGPFRGIRPSALPANEVLDGVAHRTAYAGVLGLTLVPVFMIYGTLDLGRIAASQDAQFTALAALGELGLGPVPPIIERVTAPLWGVLLNPAAFVLYLACAMQMTRKPRPRGERIDVGAAHRGPASGRQPLRGADDRDRLLSARRDRRVRERALPRRLVDPVARPGQPHRGARHRVRRGCGDGALRDAARGCFGVKVAALVVLQIQMRASRSRYARLSRIGWRWIAAASVLNILATAAVILATPIEPT